jgi:exo-1,4-beta-D-glucosaminidase
MLNNAWPGLIWHLYSYDLLPAGGYYGSKIALEQVHVQFSYDDRSVAIVNGTQAAQTDLKIVAKVFDLTGKEKFSREATADVAADAVARPITIPEPAGISATYFLRLQLFSANGILLSNNFYWLSTKPDELDFAKTEWYYTPQTAFADFTALQDLPTTSVRGILSHGERMGKNIRYKVTMQNLGNAVAFLTRLRLVRGREKTEPLPVFWSDNYLSLLPGEKREVTVQVRELDMAAQKPELLIDGFNVQEMSTAAPPSRSSK